MKALAATLMLSVFAGCDSTTLIASACRDGECTLMDSPDSDTPPTCSVGATDIAIGVINSPEKVDTTLFTLCLPHDLPKHNDGTVECSVRATFKNEEATRRNCDDVFQGKIDTDEYGTVYCALEQLTREKPLADQGPGFYFDSESDAIAEMCSRSNGQRIAFMPENLLYVLEEFRVDAHCEFATANLAAADVLNNPEDAVYLAIDNCSVPKQTAAAERKVGTPCEPRPIYGDDFHIFETYLEPDAQTCGTGMCMAFHIDGNISPDCDPKVQNCVSEELLRDRAVCTCRCSADDPGDAELCTCPDDYTCSPMLRNGEAAGGYCVKSSITTPR
ncbi:MAG TPA: hypothetical protein VFN67_37365 [Polyangiales bacterium]|nr:hypothetical protein [Polyangiales bacterium]